MMSDTGACNEQNQKFLDSIFGNCEIFNYLTCLIYKLHTLASGQTNLKSRIRKV